MNWGVEGGGGGGGTEKVVGPEKDEEVPLLASAVSERGLPQPYRLRTARMRGISFKKEKRKWQESYFQ